MVVIGLMSRICIHIMMRIVNGCETLNLNGMIISMVIDFIN